MVSEYSVREVNAIFNNNVKNKTSIGRHKEKRRSQPLKGQRSINEN